MKRSIQKLALAVMLLTGSYAFAQIGGDRSMQQFRYPDQRGVGQFEALEDDGTPFDGVKVRLGGAFAIQFQALDNSNGVTDTSVAPLQSIGPNFNLPTANLDLDVALADGMRAHIRTYLSSRHHHEAYVKGGYVQISSLDFIQEDFLKSIMDITTIKIGLMEMNYGDYHFRRSDNARAIYNPFVGNLIMDAFTTEAGAEVYFTPGDFLLMAGVSNGNLNQSVTGGDNQTPVFLGKLGWDREINDDLRLRLTGSIYTSADGQTNYLYTSDRTGGRYYSVMVPEGVDDFRSGRFNPNFKNEVTAVMINPFVKYKGIEFLGAYETSSGKASNESDTRSFTQMYAELLYRFGKDENLYVGGRYNTVSGPLAVGANDISIDRYALAAGWYMTKNVMMKAEYVNQSYKDFAETDILYDGKFNGVVLEAVISF